MAGGRPPIDERARFLAKVKMMGSGCHEWQAGTNWQGYGKIYFRGTNSYPAHRAAHTLFVGEIPEGVNVLHKCDNKKCVNPDHLFLGSLADNVADMDRKGRRGTKSRLTYADVALIKRMLGERHTQQIIADRFGVDQTVISRVKRGKTTLFKEEI